MNAKSWTAIITETKSFLEVDYCDDPPQMEPLRRYRSEPDLATCWRHSNGTCKSKCITMVNQFAAMSQNLHDDDEVSSNDFKLQNIPKRAKWHLREFEDEEIALFGNDPVPMGHSSGTCKPITMVNLFAAMPTSLDHDEVSIKRFKSQNSSKMTEWHLRDDEEIALFGTDPVPMESQAKGFPPPSKKSRPCKGQRMRYRKFMEKLMFSLRSDPDGFELDEASWPPSLAANIGRKASLITYLQSEKKRILRDREIDHILAPLLVGGTVSE